MFYVSAHDKRNNQQGFTIVEFMIATTIFSLVLLVFTFSIVHISKIYQRSINTSRTQAVARNIVDNISQSLRYSGGPVTTGTAGSTMARCMGVTKQFLYITGVVRKTKDNSIMSTRQINDPDCTAIDIQTTLVGEQLIPINMRLANLDIHQIGNSSLWSVSVKVVYGDDDVLDNKNLPSASCKPGAGSEFCAISEIATTVQRRL